MLKRLPIVFALTLCIAGAPLLASFARSGKALSTPTEVEITNEPHHHLVLENEYVRAFRVEVAPHDATEMHRHRHDYVYVTLGASEVSNELAGKPPATLKLQDGETHFTPGNFAHIARNLADTPFRNVTVEFLQDAVARDVQSPGAPKPNSSRNSWDEDRGLHVLNAGTQEILFVKDGVRVSDIQLQPGGSIPRHHHDAPHLVIAVNDLDLRSDVEGKGPMPASLKLGEVKWVPGGFTHTLTNVGKQPAHLIALEFH
jgi:quercetin dioxygenase-like cupin family protein